MLAASSCVVRSATRCSSSSFSLRTWASACCRSAISRSRKRFDCSSASARRPISTSISLNASTSTPISSFVVLRARSVKSLLSTTRRASAAISRIGWVRAFCSQMKTASPTNKLSTATTPKIPR
ncbi:hypothetical protein D3C83_23680 [compost metagenome]